jgi:hypothetical protein
MVVEVFKATVYKALKAVFYSANLLKAIQTNAANTAFLK